MKTAEFGSALFELEVVTHIAHLQSGSYAEHMALNEVYTGIVDLRDRFLESYQGYYGIVKGYKSFSISEGEDMILYLQGCVKKFDEYRKTLELGYLQQICDDILELLNSAIYKLRFLR